MIVNRLFFVVEEGQLEAAKAFIRDTKPRIHPATGSHPTRTTTTFPPCSRSMGAASI